MSGPQVASSCSQLLRKRNRCTNSWPSTETRRISSFHNFLSCSHYFRKYFKFVYTKQFRYGNFDHRYNVSAIHLHALLGVRNFIYGSACAPTAYEAVRDCRMLEKHYTVILPSPPRSSKLSFPRLYLNLLSSFSELRVSLIVTLFFLHELNKSHFLSHWS
jgi:hypothetical protein